MASKILIKRGLSENIDNLELVQGELALTTDTNQLYTVDSSGNKIEIGKDIADWNKSGLGGVNNRPMYAEESSVQLVSEDKEFTISEYAPEGFTTSNYVDVDIKPGHKYRVTIGEKSYEGICKQVNSWLILDCGDVKLEWGGNG